VEVTVAPNRITVADDGSGIPADLLPRIFEPRFSTTTSGSGLGLAIVREIAVQHAAEVTVTDASTRSPPGTLITVRLPASPVTEAELLSSGPAAGSSRSPSGSPGPARA
jgi:signal transduction histidine kinase